jgi:hypothetical protein
MNASAWNHRPRAQHPIGAQTVSASFDMREHVGPLPALADLPLDGRIQAGNHNCHGGEVIGKLPFMC